jgi:branched-chain amino acid transport system permease protein
MSEAVSSTQPARARPSGKFAGINIELVLGIVLIVGSVLLPALAGDRYWSHNFIIVNLFVIVAVLQNLLLSDAGQVSFGQGAIFGIAAYTTGIVSGLWGYDYMVGAFAGVGAAVVLGLLFAAPSLRVQGFYLGFVTLSAAIVFPEMLVAFSGFTNGINGIARLVPSLTAEAFAGVSWIALLVMVVAIVSLAGHAWFRQTPLGRRMRVAAVSPEAALTLGTSPGRMRFIAFTIAAVGTGIAGALYVPVLGFVSPYAFKIDLSIFFFFSVIVGGVGRLAAPILGAWILYLVPNALLADLAQYRLLGYGIVAFLIMLAFPDGLIGSLAKAMRRYRVRKAIGDIDFNTILSEGRRLPPARPATATDVAAIETRKVRKAYGSMVALDDVSVTIAPGVIHAIVGPNGSGKTTLLNVISGLARVDSGAVIVQGQDTTHSAGHATALMGIARTFQTPRVFEEMSIWDNLRIGADFQGARASSWIMGVLEKHRQEWSSQNPDILPHAQRRVLEIMRALAMDTPVILLDEPAAGLSPEERRGFVALLKFLRDGLGKTVVLIEHDLHLVWQVADRITVLDAGAVVADGLPQAIIDDPYVRGLFTGGTAPEAANA